MDDNEYDMDKKLVRDCLVSDAAYGADEVVWGVIMTSRGAARRRAARPTRALRLENASATFLLRQKS